LEESVGAIGELVAARIGASEVRQPRRRSRRIPLAVAFAGAAAAAVAVLTLGSAGEDATAAFRKAAAVSAAAAEQSGVAEVQITHDGSMWAGKTVRWHGGDLAVSSEWPARSSSGLIVVDGTLYGPDPEGGWLELGPTSSIDPDSGTTPAEYLAAIREDIGGASLRRITSGVTGPTTEQLVDGSTVYRGSLPAGLLARETGFKEGQAIRVLPFGYVAHGEAADPSARLDAAMTVGADGVLRELAVTWGTWSYVVAYSELGSGLAIAAPKNARLLGRG
jgi:hypothetical protein